ncbi:unnamed protein product [Trichobilharzia szidati]|nr:unnamed protein product [Trichobilharzia szidati]
MYSPCAFRVKLAKVYSSCLRFSSIRYLSSHVKSEVIDNEVQILTLNHPKSANSLSLTLMKEFLSFLESIKSSKSIRALMITGEGRFFSAGHNLHEIVQLRDVNPKEVFSMAVKIMKELAELPVPSIAAVNGPAVAAGCQLVAACDLAISAKSAIFAASGIKLGLFCNTPGVPLVRAIGLRAANELLLTGKNISADRAYELGLVHRVVDDDKLYTAAIDFAKEITQHSKDAMRLGRETLHKQASMPLMEAYTLAAEAMVQNLQFDDTKQGIQSFLNRKK